MASNEVLDNVAVWAETAARASAEAIEAAGLQMQALQAFHGVLAEFGGVIIALREANIEAGGESTLDQQERAQLQQLLIENRSLREQAQTHDALRAKIRELDERTEKAEASAEQAESIVDQLRDERDEARAAAKPLMEQRDELNELVEQNQVAHNAALRKTAAWMAIAHLAFDAEGVREFAKRVEAAVESAPGEGVAKIAATLADELGDLLRSSAWAANRGARDL